MKKKNFLAVNATKLLLCAVFILFVFYPFAMMVAKINPDDFTKIVKSATFMPAVMNTLQAALTTTVISVTLGLCLAFAIQRTNIRAKGLWTVLLTIPMLIPSFSHGTSLIALFGNNGIIRELLGIEGTIYGFTGIITGSVLYSYPVAFLMFNDVLKYQDASPYEAAAVLGIPKFNTVTAITLPYLAKPLVSSVFTVFTLVATDYGIPLAIGGKTTTLAVMMFQAVNGEFNFGKGSIIGLFLLIPAVITFVCNTLLKRNSKLSYVTRPFVLKKNGLRDSAAYSICSIVVLSMLVLFGTFFLIAFSAQYPSNITFSFKHISNVIAKKGDVYLGNSLLIAMFVSVIGVSVAFITAYMTARVPSKLSGILHLFSITSLAIPGLVLGISYCMTFNGSFIYGTMAILILANIMHFFASPYQMMYNSLSKMNENLENVGDTLGISRIRMLIDVIIPQCRATMIEMFSYFFVNSMMTISAVSFLFKPSTKPLSLLITQFRDQAALEAAAIVALIILFVNVLIKTLVHVINKRLTRTPRPNPNN